MKNFIPEVVFKIRVRDEKTKGENPYKWKDKTTDDYFKNISVILFALPGAFTPTCSTYQLPNFEKLSKEFKSLGVDKIYCLSVNDKYVMKSWLISYSEEHKIHGVADGNAEITNYFNLLSDKTKNHMGYRSSRFAMIIGNNQVQKIKVENPAELKVSSAEYILQIL